jgi:hypothetical protein
MNHLKNTGFGYFQHLIRSWKIAAVLLVHGVFPDCWPNKASQLLCDSNHKH